MRTRKVRTENEARRARGGGRTAGVTSAGTRILAAIEEATEILRSEGLEGERVRVRTYEVAPGIGAFGAADVKRVRELLGASQDVLAGFLGVSPATVRSWEQGKRLPQPIARRFLSEMGHDPQYWRERIGSVGPDEFEE